MDEGVSYGLVRKIFSYQVFTHCLKWSMATELRGKAWYGDINPMGGGVIIASWDVWVIMEDKMSGDA